MEDSKWDKPGLGTLFANKNKRGNAPDYMGSFVCERDYAAGEKLKFGMWEKRTKYDSVYFALKEDTWKPDPNFRNRGTEPVREDKEVAYRPNKIYDEDVPF
jgi:hypothetical protein